MMKMDMSFYKNKRVLLTGHTGFKGTWLSQILLKAGAIVAGYALESSVKVNLFDLIGDQPDITSYFQDIRDAKSLQAAVAQFKPEIVFHLAAQPIVRKSYLNPAETYGTNVMGTLHILEAIRTCDSVQSVVVVTTDKVYENKEWIWGYRENENLCGRDPYSNSKSCAELIAYSYRESFFQDEGAPALSTARAGNVIGGGDFAEDRIIPDCIGAALNSKPILVRNPNSIRPYQHVLDCLSGYLLLAQLQYNDKNRYQGSYNFGPNESDCITTGDLVNLFCDIWNTSNENKERTLSWKSQEDVKLHESNILKLDSTKARNILQWIPIWDIEKAICKTIEWVECYQEGSSINACMNKQIHEYFGV